MNRTRAAHGEQHEFARVLTGGQRAYPVHFLSHDAVDQPLDLPGGFDDRNVQRLGDLSLQRFLGAVRPQLGFASEKAVGIDVSQHQIGVRDGRFAAAAVVGGGPRIRARTVGADLELAVDDTGDRSPARSDRPMRDIGNLNAETVDDRIHLIDPFASLDDQADIETGAAHVGDDDVALVHQPSDVVGADDRG